MEHLADNDVYKYKNLKMAIHKSGASTELGNIRRRG